MSYGGLAYGGARSIRRKPASPSSASITRAAPYYPFARARLIEPEEPRLWNSIPVEAVEGHQGDPFFDVRLNEATGLGALGAKRSRFDVETGEPAPWLRFGDYVLGPGITATPARETPSAVEPANGLPGSSAAGAELGNIWPLLLAAGVVWFFVR